MAPFGLKLWGNAFHMIPDISFFDVEKKYGKIFRQKCSSRSKNAMYQIAENGPMQSFRAVWLIFWGVNGRSKFRIFENSKL